MTWRAIPRYVISRLNSKTATRARPRDLAFAQRAIVAALQNALDARRQRILISQSAVNWVTRISLIIQATCTLAAIAMVPVDNRPAAAVAILLLQVQPDASPEATER
jgi:hypothetical protein